MKPLRPTEIRDRLSTSDTVGLIQDLQWALYGWEARKGGKNETAEGIMRYQAKQFETLMVTVRKWIRPPLRLNFKKPRRNRK